MYTIVERNIGRAGTKEQAKQKQILWNQKYGEGAWLTGYEVNGKFMTREDAIVEVYNKAYFAFLDQNPKYVTQLVNSAGVFNPHALFTNSVDIQASTIQEYMNSKGLTFQGQGYIPIGTWQPKHNKDIIFKRATEMGLKIVGDKISYPPISYALSPFNITCLHNPKLSVEGFWQSGSKCLAVKQSFNTKIGDIFEMAEDNAVVCITTNGILTKEKRAVMGKGIAEKATTLFKDIDLKLANYLQQYGNRCFRLGTYPYKGKNLIVVSFPTKEHWKYNAIPSLIEESTKQLLEMADKFGWTRIYLPFPGGGAGKLTWKQVKPLLKALDHRFTIVSLNPNDFK